MKLRFFKYLIGVFLGTLFWGCQQKQDSKYRIVFLQCCSDEWRDVMNSEMKREILFHSNLSLEIIDSYGDSQKQLQQAENLINEDIDLFIISPNESQPLKEIIEKLNKKGIPIILIDRKSNTDKYSAFVGADNYEIGKTAGNYLNDKIKYSGNILEVELPMTFSPATERHSGFAEAIYKSNHLKIVNTLETTNGLEDIDNNFLKIIQKNPEINIIFAHTDLLADRVYQVAKKHGINKRFYYMGIDAIPISKGMQNVKNGILNATLLYPTGGAESIQIAANILNNKPYSKENILLSNVISQENIDIMLAQIQKIKEQQIDIERQELKIKDFNITFSSQKNRLYFISILLILVLILGVILLYLLREKQMSNKILAEQNKSILEQKDEIEKVSKLAIKATEDKIRFYSYISHEFKTPLSLILTPVEDLLQRRNVDKSEIYSSLGLIYKNANRLLLLVNQLLEMRKLDAGKMELNLSSNDLVDFVRLIVSDFRVMAKKKNIDLQFVCVFNELLINFDPEKLDKILFNLISNAFKYTPSGGFIHISLLKNLNKFEIIISDNGVGMSEDEKNHAFDLFYRGNKNISLGTGLGLALSHEFVILHGGEIFLESEKGHGTSFKIQLPINLASNQSVKAEDVSIEITSNELMDLPELEDIESLQVTKENSIILIEDNEDLNYFLRKKLEKDYSIISVDNAEKGWDEILSNIPDMIICDITLPGMDGFSLTQHCKSDFRTSHIPIILLTAKSQIESQIEGTKAGADAYILKPFNLALLEQKIKGLLENRDRIKRRYAGEVTNVSTLQKSERRFLIEFEGLLEKHLSESNLSVEKLSIEMGMSRVQLFRKISALTDKNVVEYIAEFKILKAKNLLLDREKNVSEIAYSLGFSTPSYFTTFFKQKTGYTPSEWKSINS